jgi:outer membrane lipoprotein-sorting protein
MMSEEEGMGAGMEGSRENNALGAPHVLASARSLLLPIFAIFALSVVLPALAGADETDDLLTKRQNNFAHVKKFKADFTVDTESAGVSSPTSGKHQMKYTYTITKRDRNHPDPTKRYDMDMEITEPMHMHIKVEDGQFSYLTNKGEWVKRNLPGSASQFMAGLPDFNATDVAGIHREFDVKRRKDKDSFFGGKKGLEFIPKGKAKMYARKVEAVDSDTGIAVETDLYDEKDKHTLHLKINRLGKHNGVAVAEDMESIAFSITGMGDVIRKTKAENIVVETE